MPTFVSSILRPFRLVAGGAALFLLLGDGSWALAHRSMATHPQCLIEFWGNVKYSCYGSSDLRKAERQLSFRAFKPTRVVMLDTGLNLSQEIVMKGTWARPLRRGNEIFFVFGSSATQLFPYPSPPNPKWLVVDEGHPKGKPSQQGFTVTGGEVNTAPDVTGTVVPWSNPWTISGSLPHHHITFIIRSNEDRSTTERIATELVQKDTGSTP